MPTTPNQSSRHSDNVIGGTSMNKSYGSVSLEVKIERNWRHIDETCQIKTFLEATIVSWNIVIMRQMIIHLSSF